jgi:guanylate kinase
MKNLFLVAGKSACVDCDTEFFTGTEWKRIADYQEGDKVLQYNPDGSAELVYPEVYIKEPCENLWHFKTTRGIDQCLSEEHEVYYITSKNHLYHKPFYEVKKQHEQAVNGFDGRFITTFKYESLGISLSNEEIKLMCAVICDGTFNPLNNTTRCRINIKKERKKIELRKILSNLKIEYKENVCKTMKDFSQFYFNAPRREKEFTDYWYQCDNHQLQIICDNVIFWDGNICSPNKKGNSFNFSTSNKKTADFIQFAFSACGKRANISIRDRRGKICKNYTSNKVYYYKSIEYSVHISTNPLITIIKGHKEKNEIEQYKTIDGFKYCFTVLSGILILRRNNKIFITGNCGKDSIVADVCKKLNKTKVLSYTTRSKREGEEDTHIFIKPEEVINHKEDIIAYTKIGEYEYFATLTQLYNSDFYIIDPNGIKYLKEKLKNTDINLKIIYIYLDENIRLQRAINRGDNIEVFQKRSLSEQNQFEEFEKEISLKETYIINNNISLESSVNQLIEYVKYCN